MALQVFYQVLNLSLLMSIGFFLKKKFFNESFFTQVNRLISLVTLPCLSFAKLQVSVSSDLLGPLALVFIIGAFLFIPTALFGYFFFRKEPLDRRKVFTHLTTFSNSAFIGFPIISAAFGDGALIYGVIYVAAFNIVSWTMGVYIYGGKKALSVKKLFSNPTLIASLLGLIFFLLPWSIPTFPLNAINLVGDMTTPLSMLVIGSQLVDFSLATLKDRGLYLSCFFRLVLLPLAFYLCFRWLPLPFMVFEVLFIIFCMPSAAVTAIQAQQYGANQPLAAKGVALSTVCSIITIPLMMLLL